MRGCGCKGSQGHAHVTCLAKQAQLSVEEGETMNADDMSAKVEQVDFGVGYREQELP